MREKITVEDNPQLHESKGKDSNGTVYSALGGEYKIKNQEWGKVQVLTCASLKLYIIMMSMENTYLTNRKGLLLGR